MTEQSGRRRWLRWVGWAVVAVAVLVAGVLAWWLLTVPDVEPVPLQAVEADPDLEVTRADGVVTLAPAGAAGAGVEVVFYPGAGVPPDAYLATWAPVVEETGITVLIPDMPLRLAVLDLDRAASVREASGFDGPWWVGGHSLGGAMAASWLADAPTGTWDGLVLWAAYPSGDALADRDVDVVSVAGSRDGLTTPAEVEASRSDLPADAVITILDGVSHAQFGAYGDQRGDGVPTVDDETARTTIAEATARGMAGTG